MVFILYVLMVAGGHSCDILLCRNTGAIWSGFWGGRTKYIGTMIRQFGGHRHRSNSWETSWELY